MPSTSDIAKTLQDIVSLFSNSSDTALNTSIDLCALKRAKRHGYFLLDFDISDGLLSQIVGKGHFFDKGESKHCVLMSYQTIQQISALGIFGFAPLALFRWRFFGVGCLTNGLVLGYPRGLVWEDLCTFPALLVKFKEQILHFGSPSAALLD